MKMESIIKITSVLETMNCFAMLKMSMIISVFIFLMNIFYP